MLTASIVLPQLKQNTSIVSQALNEDGSPAVDALVTLYRDDVEIALTITDAAGIYRFEDIIEGSYRVKIELKDGSDVLYVDYSEIGGTNIENVSFASITPASLNVEQINGKTIVTVNSGGTGYSKNVPPQIVTDDGYLGIAEVGNNGTITSIETLNEGSGTSTTASIFTAPVTPPFLGTQDFGSPSSPGGPITSDPSWQQAYQETFNAIAADKLSAIREWESIAAVRGYGTDSFPSWDPGISITGASWIRPFIQVTDGPGVLGPGELSVVSCVTTYPAGKIRVYANNLNFAGIENSQLVYAGSDYWEFQKWNIEHTDYSSAVSSSGLATANEIGPGPVTAGRRIYKFVPEGAVIPPAICGIQDSYASYLENRQAFLETVNPTRPKQGTLPIKNDLPASVKSILDFLGIDGSFQSLIRYIRNYSTYSALQLVADARATQQIKDAEILYGKYSLEYANARKQAFLELNAAKGYLANEFVVKPALNLLAEKSAFNLSVIDSLRGLPSGATRTTIVNTISPYITTGINTFYQVGNSKELSLLVGAGSFAAGFPSVGTSLILRSFSNNGTQSASKAIDDLIAQTTGTYTQPSWLSNTSYDTVNLFNNLQGLRVTFNSNGTYTTTNIPAPQDALKPYMYNPNYGQPGQPQYIVNPGFQG